MAVLTRHTGRRMRRGTVAGLRDGCCDHPGLKHSDALPADARVQPVCARLRLDTAARSRYRSRMAHLIITSASDIMGGAPVFAGTRVPVRTLLDYLEAGDGIDDFLAGFPSVTRLQVIAFLERATTLAVADSGRERTTAASALNSI